MRALNVLLAILISLLMGALALEGGLRLIGLGPPNTINKFDPHTGWSKKPDARGTRKSAEFDVAYELNGLGLRDDAMDSPAKPEGTFRVVMLGDSFTLGYTVQRKDLFVDQLEQKWNAEGRRVDVINAGTEAWSTDQEVAWFLAHGESFEPDLVVLLPYDNDIYWCSESVYVGGREKPRFTAKGKLEERELLDTTPQGLWGGSALHRIMNPGRLDPRFEPEGGASMRSEDACYLVDAPEFFGESKDRARGALQALRDECRTLGAELVVAPIPNKETVDPSTRERRAAAWKLPESAWSPTLPFETYVGFCQDLGIECIDVREPMVATFEAEGEPLYFDRDFHLNAAGNLAFARALDSALANLDPFGADHAAVTPTELTPPEISEVTAAAGGIPTWMIVYGVLFTVLALLYRGHYPDESLATGLLSLAAFLGFIFLIFFGVGALVGLVPPQLGPLVALAVIMTVLFFVLVKMGSRVLTVLELFKSFVLRGHWYLMPLVVVLLTVGSLLVVAASSPLVAPFIYTLF